MFPTSEMWYTGFVTSLISRYRNVYYRRRHCAFQVPPNYKGSLTDLTLITRSNDMSSSTSLPEPTHLTSMTQLWFIAKTATTENELDSGLEKIEKARQELQQIKDIMRKKKEEVGQKRRQEATSSSSRRSDRTPTFINIENAFNSFKETFSFQF